jgi:hypothetical protein
VIETFEAKPGNLAEAVPATAAAEGAAGAFASDLLSVNILAILGYLDGGTADVEGVDIMFIPFY